MMTQQRIRTLEQEVGRLKASVAALEASRVVPPQPVGSIALEEYVRSRAGVHPSKKPKKAKKQDNMLKATPAGACLTRPEVIAAFAVQEAEVKKKETAAAKAKDEAAQARKEARQQRTAENKKRKAEEKANRMKDSRR
jgi:hypothetical protein